MPIPGFWDDPEEFAKRIADEIRSTGVDHVLARLNEAAAAAPDNTELFGMLATVRGQAHNLRSPRPPDPGHILRQLCVQAAELRQHNLSAALRWQLRATPKAPFVPLWTTRRASLALLAELQLRDEPHTIAVLPDGRVFVAEKDGRFLLWKPDERPAPVLEEFSPPPGSFSRTEAATLPNGLVATCHGDQRILLWNPDSPRTAPTEIATGAFRPREIAAFPDGRIATIGIIDGASADDRLVVWAPSDAGKSPAWTPTQMKYRLGSPGRRPVVVLRKGRRIATVDWRGQLLLFRTRRPRRRPRSLGRFGTVLAMVLMPNGRLLTGGDNALLAVDPGWLRRESVLIGRSGRRAHAVAALSDGQVVSAEICDGVNGSRVLVWDPRQAMTQPAVLARHDGRVVKIAPMADGRLVSCARDGRVLVLNPETDSGMLDSDYRGIHVAAAATLADGRIVTGGKDYLLAWSTTAGYAHAAEVNRELTVVTAVGALPASRALDGPAGERIVEGLRGGKLRLWDLDRTKQVRPWPGGKGPQHEGDVMAIVALRDGRAVTGGADGRVLMWDSTAPRAGWVELGRHHRPVAAAVVLPNGLPVTLGEDGQMLQWDPDSPGTLPVLLASQPRAFHSAAMLPTGHIATGDAEGRVLSWDPLGSGITPTALLGRHRGIVTSIAVLSKRLIATSGDDCVAIWDLTAPGNRPLAQANCVATALAVAPIDVEAQGLLVGHKGSGVSLWAVT